MPPRITNITRDALAVAFNDLLGGAAAPGVFKIFDGTKPTDVDDGNGSGTLLASMTFASVAFQVTTSADATHGVLSLTSVLYDDNTDGTGTPTWGLIEDVSGNKLLDFNISGDLAVPPITAGGKLTIGVLNLTIPALSNSASGDIDLDGFVGQADLDVVLLNWGKFI